MPKNKTVRTPTTAMKLDMDDKPEENGAEDQGDGSVDQNGTKGPSTHVNIDEKKYSSE